MVFTDICLITEDVLNHAKFYEMVFNAKPDGKEIHSLINAAIIY